jgi:hypothetical protein
MTPAQIALPVQRPNPLMQFWGRVDGGRAYVRIQGSRLEWSRVGQEWIITMAPMTSITAVRTQDRSATSSLIVSTTVGIVEFKLEPDIAEQARALLVRLIAESAAQLPSESLCSDDELINLKWELDAGVVNDFEFEHEWARVLES